jgi:hypothetical protein
LNLLLKSGDPPGLIGGGVLNQRGADDLAVVLPQRGGDQQVGQPGERQRADDEYGGVPEGETESECVAEALTPL